MHSPLPILALLFNALVWGLAWWPLRRMFDAGLHPLWATAVMYAMVLAALLALGNWALQYGASRLAASVTAVVMLSEIAFASVSSVLLGAARLDSRSLLGGALILSAAAWSAWPRPRSADPAPRRDQ